MNDKLAWWRENRLGLFVHWGLYAATEGYWNGIPTQSLGEWIQCTAKIPLREYARLADKMTLEDFDADEWVRLARHAGMGHIVITAKHHEGFAMYDSACSDYNIVRMGPSGRDPLKELSEACARGGIRFCLYYSHCLDFAHPDACGNTWDFDPAQADFGRYFEEKCKPQLRELLTGYGPIGVIWFDMPRTMTEAQTREIKAMVHELQPDCICAARLGFGLEDYASLGDNALPCGLVTTPAETPATLNDTWGYKRDDQNWKDVPELVESLAELASCGVNYLVNIGPMAGGRIPDGSVKTLTGLGNWMTRHREGIVGTQGSPFPSHGDNWMATQKGNTLYLFLRQWSTQLSLCGLRNRVVTASLPAAPEKTVQVAQSTKGDRYQLDLELPESPPSPYTNVIVLELDGRPDCVALPCEQPDGCITLPANLADVHPGSAPLVGANGGTIATEMAVDHTRLVKEAERIANWRRPDDRISWRFLLDAPGRYDVILRTTGRKYGTWIGGQAIRATIDTSSTEGSLRGEEPVRKPRTRYFPEHGSSVESIALDKPGAHTLTLTASTFVAGSDLSLTEVVLRRTSP